MSEDFEHYTGFPSPADFAALAEATDGEPPGCMLRYAADIDGYWIGEALSWLGADKRLVPHLNEIVLHENYHVEITVRRK